MLGVKLYYAFTIGPRSALINLKYLCNLNMMEFNLLTFTNTRFLAFIELGYLYEAAKATDEHFASIIASLKEEDASRVENINATRNSLLRAVFISSYAILEQNLDELIKLDHKRLKVSISPNDLKYGGILRSLLYAEKFLGIKLINHKTTGSKSKKYKS